MGKYTDQAKLTAVTDYCSGEGGLKAVARNHGVDATSLRQWVAGYRALGETGIQTKKRNFFSYTVEFKLSVLRRMREEGLSRRQTAALFNIRRVNVIGEWEHKYNQGAPEALSEASRGRCKKMPGTRPMQVEEPNHDQNRSQQDLLDELSRLRMENAYLKKPEALIQANDQQARESAR